jgi:hypothetical protein
MRHDSIHWPTSASLSRWVAERTHSWMNGYGKLRRCTERNPRVVDFYLYLAAAFRHRPPAHPANPHALPLEHPPDNQTPQVTPIAGHSK